ncbi:MAG: hypothetical protein A3J38_02895 [Gammaproteobacteria bacterium RIFCSPHIGHO2_12_FULL_45_9]|nr:MAG: hypothetical protein A3J38_02895 [Gammaproteobacteria bacterium RIFCSPHIGHO2_12_FULL_45_9]
MVPLAGDHVTADIAIAFRTPTSAAESVKREHGSVALEAVDADQVIQVMGVAKRPPKQIPKRVLAHVMHARYEEILQLVHAELVESGYLPHLAAGIVLTGGATRAPGVLELAEQILGMPVRLGLPQHIQGLLDVRENPSYATGVGLLLHGWQMQRAGSAGFHLQSQGASLWSRVRQWFQGNF